MISPGGEDPSLNCPRPNPALPEQHSGQMPGGETDSHRTLAGRVAWAVLLIGLLLVELLGLTLRFDTGSLEETDAWWARLLEHAPSVARLAAVIGVATL